jgi:filamentous hemagglutinin family protein
MWMIRATPPFFGDMLDMIRMIKNSALHMVAILSMFCLVSRFAYFSFAGEQSIIPDQSTGTIVTQKNDVFEITGGKIFGQNLFHSFDKFNLNHAETGVFKDTGFNNTIGRVTGGKPSNINGIIKSEANNFYLINPNGIIFGDNAELSIAGSFYISTGHYIKFNDGKKFYTDLSMPENFSSEPISAFGFLDGNVSSITFNNVNIDLKVDKSISIAGANIQISNSRIGVPAGSIYLLSTSSPGEYILGKKNCTHMLEEFDRYSDITLNYSVLTISNAESFDTESIISVESDNLFLYDHSFLNASPFNNQTGGDIYLFAKQSIRAVNVSSIVNSSFDEGVAGQILMQANTISFDNKAGISCHSEIGGAAGDLKIFAVNSFQLNNGEITASAFEKGKKAGNISIMTNKIQLTNSNILLKTHTDVQGGNISLINAKVIELKNSFVTTESEGSSKNANGGNIQMTGNIDNIYLLDSTISTSVEDGIGNAGHISIENAQSVVLNRSNIITQADEGYGGDIYIVSETFIQSSDSMVDASSRLGVDGDVTISPDARVGQNLNTLASNPLDHTKLLEKKCTQCSEKNNNSLMYQYADGVPVPLEDWQACPPLPFPSELILDTSNMKQGEQLFRKGHFKEAIQLWQASMNRYVNVYDPVYVQLLLYVSRAYQYIGKYHHGISTLAMTIPDQANVTSVKDFIQKFDLTIYPGSVNALVFNQLSDLALIQGDIQHAEVSTAIAFKQAQSDDNPYILACVYNNKGNVLIEKRRHYEALTCYEKAIKVLEKIDSMPSWMIQSKACLNWIRLNIHTPFYEQQKIHHTVDMAIDIINKLDDTHQKASDLISLGLMIQHDDTSAQLFQHALTISTINKDNRTQSLATGLANDILINRFLSENTDNAIQTAHQVLTQNHKAMFYAQSYPEIQYLWQWQRAKFVKHLHKKKINNELFNNACPFKLYQHALEILTPVKSCFLNGFHSTDTKRAYFKKHIRALYMELIESFLDKPKPEKMDLNNALTLLEKLKESEIDNYFDDECLVYLQKLKNKTFGNTPKMISFRNDTAIIYPIDLEDQWIVFMATGDAIDLCR